MSSYHHTPEARKGMAMYRAGILERDDYTCYIDGAPADQVDHVIPISRGGTTEPDNLAAICGPCNRAKGDKILTRRQYVNPKYR